METKLNRENARRVHLIEAFLAGLHTNGTISVSDYPTETHPYQIQTVRVRFRDR